MCDDLVPVGDPARPRTYPVELLGCPRCITVHQKYQIERTVLFPRTYHYRARMTEDVLKGMAELVELAGDLRGDLTGITVLDVGCNDGSLLNLFRQAGARTVGIEPTGAADDALARVDHVINRYFDDNSVNEYLERFPKPDIITFTNVFAHIDDLGAIVDCIRKISKPDTLIVIENHYLGAVLDRNQFDTFYQEHPRTYSYRSFEYIANMLGMPICHVDFPKRYNGNIRVAIGRIPSPKPLPTIDESGFVAAFPQLVAYVEASRKSMMAQLTELAGLYGPLCAKAFPGRASVILSYYGVDESLIGAAYERSGSPKIGYYIPGTRIPIRDEAELFAMRNVPVVVNLAWHIKDEIHRYMRAQGYTGKIVEIFS